MSNGNFNNTSSLFKNAREYYQVNAIVLMVVDGHITAGKDGVVARFDGTAAACAALEEAGYTRENFDGQTLYHP